MYTYIPTSTTVPVPMYIPVTSVYAQPSTGPTWLILLIVSILFIILITFWVSIVKDILEWGAELLNVSLLIIITLVIISLLLLLIL